MDFDSFKVLFYVVVSIVEVYKFCKEHHQNKKLDKALARIDEFIDKNNKLDK